LRDQAEVDLFQGFVTDANYPAPLVVEVADLAGSARKKLARRGAYVPTEVADPGYASAQPGNLPELQGFLQGPDADARDAP
jgi:hypothetical protein